MSIPVLLKGSSGISQVSMEAEHMSKRRLFIVGDITEDSASDFMKQVMYLNTEDSDSPISVFINSSGGEINNGMLMYDVIMDSEAPIHMYCTGRAHSMGAVLFACARERYILPNSEIMLHQPLLAEPIGGNADSIKSVSDSLLKTRIRLNKILALHTGKTEQEMNQATAFDHYFTAQEAVDFGLADGIKSFKEMMED